MISMSSPTATTIQKTMTTHSGIISPLRDFGGEWFPDRVCGQTDSAHPRNKLDEVEDEPDNDHNDEDCEKHTNNVVRHSNLPSKYPLP